MSITITINLLFGSQLTIPVTRIILNNGIPRSDVIGWRGNISKALEEPGMEKSRI
jgi:gamma-glutamyltranspeptidase